MERNDVITYTDGVHEVKSGKCFVMGTANVEAHGDAEVVAFDDAKVSATGNAKVATYNHAEGENAQ